MENGAVGYVVNYRGKLKQLFNRDRNVGKSLFDHVGHPACSWADSLEHRTSIDANFNHPQTSQVRSSTVLRVPESALQHFFEHARSALRLEFKDCHRIVDVLSANEVRKRADLSRANPCVSVNCSVSHCFVLESRGAVSCSDQFL
jgi:hypothetical protein